MKLRSYQLNLLVAFSISSGRSFAFGKLELLLKVLNNWIFIAKLLDFTFT